MAYHSFLFTNVGRNQIVEEKEGVRIDRDKDVILKVGYETAIHARFIFCKKGVQIIY